MVLIFEETLSELCKVKFPVVLPRANIFDGWDENDSNFPVPEILNKEAFAKRKMSFGFHLFQEYDRETNTFHPRIVINLCEEYVRRRPSVSHHAVDGCSYGTLSYEPMVIYRRFTYLRVKTADKSYSFTCDYQKVVYPYLDDIFFNFTLLRDDAFTMTSVYLFYGEVFARSLLERNPEYQKDNQADTDKINRRVVSLVRIAGLKKEDYDLVQMCDTRLLILRQLARKFFRTYAFSNYFGPISSFVRFAHRIETICLEREIINDDQNRFLGFSRHALRPQLHQPEDFDYAIFNLVRRYQEEQKIILESEKKEENEQAATSSTAIGEDNSS
ncbi:Oidioi.mRNA.OKI2018_I69.chr2.g6163.t1.cds [Oikopleura dioica]|uniref:Oidioi.mRNA.OKI2018_I69.chr2.g6163.t1.cds n=1 Tax=Oikopleura dioica TaxID=34765 RepID=A0ABN7T6W5_OIKDI|nr:Oidioi.mRNA.OKI2018_I69.chr2.g6163.t1.cds [Oikopleura dioica]